MDRPFLLVGEPFNTVAGDNDVELGQVPLSLDLELENVFVHHSGGTAAGYVHLLVGGRPFGPIGKIASTFAGQYGDPIRQIPLGMIVPHGSIIGVRLAVAGVITVTPWIWGNLIEPGVQLRSPREPHEGMPTMGRAEPFGLRPAPAERNDALT